MKKLEYYGAKWCGPCQALKPIIKELKGDGLNIEIIDIDENPDRATKNSVMSVPTVIIYKDGEIFERLLGFKNKEEIVYLMSES
jgi:thioredoxin 1|tara:strand:- start:132 stop:383 length:252 start_codon:yes stop_codon:yes gene_type:complete